MEEEAIGSVDAIDTTLGAFVSVLGGVGLN